MHEFPRRSGLAAPDNNGTLFEGSAARENGVSHSIREPRTGLLNGCAVKESYFGARKGPAKDAHALLPFLVSDKSKSLDVRKVFKVELEVVPQRAGTPTMEVHHLEKHSNFAVLSCEAVERGDEALVVVMAEFAGDPDLQNLPIVFRIQTG